MRKAFALLDDLLIERIFQPAVSLIASHTSLSQDRVICWCLDFASITWILSRVGALSGVSRVGAISGAISAPHPAAMFLDLGVLLLGLTALISLRNLFRRPKFKQANPLRLAMQPHRAVVLLMLACTLLRMPTSGLAERADLAMLVFTAGGLYFGACAGHRPRRHRLGLATRWIRPLRGIA